MDGADIQKRVARLVREKTAAVEDADAASAFVLLGEGGIFDSVSALELILAIEREFGIVVKDDEVRPENLRNIECLVNFVKSALARQSQDSF